MLNDDRRRPIIWANTAIGLVCDCFSAMHTDYRFFQDTSTMYQIPTVVDSDVEHYWAFPELVGIDVMSLALPAIASSSFASRSIPRLDLGNNVCLIAFDRRVRGEGSRSASETRCNPLSMPKAASCFAMNAPSTRALIYGWSTQVVVMTWYRNNMPIMRGIG